MGASGGMTSQRWTPAVCFLLASVFGMGESMTTSEIHKYSCRTFGSGVLEPFSGLGFYVLSSCPFTLTRFTHNRVECDITIRRGNGGLLVQVEIIINKVSTVLQNGSILVEEKRVSLPYDHTYQHIFQYGIYTRLRSSLLPLSVTWHSVPGGIDSLWVELEQELSTDMTGLCGKHNATSNEQQLIRESVISDNACQTRDPAAVTNPLPHYSCNLSCSSTRSDGSSGDICSYEKSKYIGCAFFKEVALHCGKNSYIWDNWRSVTQCAYPTCPGDLMYEEEGAAFVPSCSNPHPQLSSQDITSSCICPQGEVLNDQSDGFRCMNLSSCPCVLAGRTYLTGDIRNTKCQSCLCEGGKWRCSGNVCPAKCRIEGQFVTTFDGKQYVIPGKCTYLALQGLNWTVIIQFSEDDASLKKVVLQRFQDLQEIYTFTNNMVTFGDQEITDFHESDHAQVFWQSSMYVHVETSSDIMIQIQMSPEIQLYVSAPTKHESVIAGLCGNNNGDSTDDFTSSSGIIENSAEPFALSWSVGACAVNIPNTCINAHNEIFADEKCSALNNPTGIFSECHKHLPPDQYHAACIQRTCNCGSSVERCLCVALGSYAKACASLGVLFGDWRKATNCTLSCPKNQEFFYNIRACNRTCGSLSGTGPFCSLNDAPVEGCGCPEGTYLNQESTCTQKADCVCRHHGGITLPGPAVIEGRQCLCENGRLTCSKDCSCKNGKVCVHCSENPIKTAQKTCDSLSKPLDSNMTCKSGCYCPNDQYEDHYGNCVSRDNCTCVYSGEVFSAGQHVRTNCKKCTCGQGQWDCNDEPCQGTCQVYGNGHYETFDSKWYRFSGHCQYTLVEDYCGSTNGTFSVRVESVPCCEEALTCSRSIVLDLQGKVTLILNDMKVAKRLQQDWTLQENSLYSVDTVGLYIIVSVPSSGITLIWDKHTRLTIKLHENWRNKVCGLCGNFDSNEMNDLQISGSAVMSSTTAFGNSWKAAAPPCSDVTADIFPCDRNSYCSAWAQRRCMIIKGDTFKDCHLKVDPNHYYQACLLESCSCEFEGKFLGFCTAVAAYAEACSDQDVCIKWRTPDLCPIYCDFYNKPGQSIWHYEACGEMQICGKEHHFTDKLEGCYPRCPKETPYYDVNTEECATLTKCSCYFNDTVVQPGEVVMINSFECPCENGTITCRYPMPETTSMTEIWTMIPTTNTSSIGSANTSTTTETGLTMSTTFSMPTTTAIVSTTEEWSGKTSTTVATSTKTGTWSRIPTTSTPNPTFTSAATENITTPTSTSIATSSSVETWSPIPITTSIITAEVTSATTETLSTNPTTISTPTSTSTSATTETWPIIPTTIPTLDMSNTSTAIITPTTPTTPTETWSTMSTAIPTSATATSASVGTPLTTLSTTSTLTTVETSLFTETWSTIPNTISTPASTAPSGTTGALSSMPTTTFTLTAPASSSTHETLATIPTPSSPVTRATSAITERSSMTTNTSLPTSKATSATTKIWSAIPTIAFTHTPRATATAEKVSGIPTTTFKPTTTASSTTTKIWSAMPTTTLLPTTTDVLSTTKKMSGQTSATSSSTTVATSTKTGTWSRIPTITTSTLNPTFTSAATENITIPTSTSIATSSSVETWSPISITTSIITAEVTSATTETLSTNPTTISTPTTTSTSATTETWPIMPTTIPTLDMSNTSTAIVTPTTATTPTTPTETWSTMSTAIPTSATATSASAGTPLTTLSTTSTLTTVETSLFTETWSTISNTISTPASTAPSGTTGALSSMPTTTFTLPTPASSSTTETLATIPTTPISSAIMASSAITEQSSTSTTTSLLSTWSKNPNTISNTQTPTTTTITTEKWSTVPTSTSTATTTPIIETMPTTTFTPTTEMSPNSTETQSIMPTITPIQPNTSTVTPTETRSTMPTTTSISTSTRFSHTSETRPTMPTSAQITKLISATTEKWSLMETNSYMPTTTDISDSTGQRSIFPVATSTQTGTDTSTSTETLPTMPPTMSRPVVSNSSNSSETWSATPSTISTLTSTSTTTETWSEMPRFTSTITASSFTTEAWSTIHTTTSTPTTKATLTTSETLSTMTTARPATTVISTITQKTAEFPTNDSTLITPSTSSSTVTKTWSTVPTTTFILTTGSTSAASETRSMPTVSKPTATTTSIPTWPTTSTSTTTETSSSMPTITSIPPVTGASTITEILSTTSKHTTSATSPATETRATMPTTTYSQPTTATLSNSREAWSEMSTTTSVLMTTNADVSMITKSTSNAPISSVTPEKSSTIATTSLLTTSTDRMRATSSLATAAPTQPTSVIHTTLLSLSTGAPEIQSSTSKVVSTPLPVCECKDLNKKKNWACGEMWTDDCFHKYCMNGKIVLTPLECPEPTIPHCPRGRVTKVSEGCCETWKCDCHCDLYGETHYISFQGVTFDFLDQCTYILVEERSPRHNLTIGVDSFNCVPGVPGSCSRDIILRYQNNVATLSIVPHLFKVQATLNNVIVQPPYEEHGLKFDTVEHKVIIQLPDIRSFVSLTPYYTMLVSLAMENFDNNTQGQCGVCGGASCIRKGGQIEHESCCDKTAYDWMIEDPQKPACFSAPKEVPCHSERTSLLTKIPATCLPSLLCELLDSIVFENCSNYVNLNPQKKNCKFDSCSNPNASCSALEQAAEECKNAGFCVDWRRLTNGTCDVTCPDGLIYRECYDKQDDFCYVGLRYSGASLKESTAGCFCPSSLLRAGKHSNMCVADCSFCKGPTGEPKLPGEVWQSNCYLCTCNNQTYTEECFPKPPEPAPVCGPTAVLVNSSCCGDQICVEKTCHYNQQIYKAGDRWTDPAHPCVSFSCSKEGIQTETKGCPEENCPEEDRIWDDQHCCYTCRTGCAPRVSSINITIENCSSVVQIPLCHGQCASQPRVVLKADLVLEQENTCCTEQSSERRSVTLHCSDRTTREYAYKHITSCVCKTCSTI